ncbi:hypothetical protein B0H10DRAFT_2082626 [Mycena sp. CBHHK59/15]|nr:hypothetical protein B0H10DRAFT_2082626 [Mycena sp. CBHHK59/15]
MARQTRSGTQFSPYALDSLTRDTRVAIDPLIEDALGAADRYFQGLDDGVIIDDEDSDQWEDAFDCRLITALIPPHSRAVSPSASASSHLRLASPHSRKSRSVTPLSDSRPMTPMLIDPAVGDADVASPAHEIHRRRRNEQAAARRRERRRRAAPHTPFERRPNMHRSQTHREEPPETVNVDAGDLPSSSGGAWTGRRSGKGKCRPFTLPELLAMKCKVIYWNGRDPKLILDARGRIVAILIGRPEDPDWDEEMHRARRKGMRHRVFKSARPLHRRGRFSVLAAGVSFGGGQKRPGNLVNNRFARRLIQRLLKNQSIRRFAGFQSSALATYAPKLYRYYCLILKALFEQEPGLIHNFSNSIFPVVTFNCGPDTVTFDHRDGLNLSHGLCAITCGGNFDHTLGGHIYLKQLKLVIEYPSGSSVLIPSGCVNHGNTPLQPGETRTSMTQYAAGGLFRWVTYGFQSAKSLLSKKGGKEIRDQHDGAPGSRWEEALDMFSKYDDLVADQIAVFGSG